MQRRNYESDQAWGRIGKGKKIKPMTRGIVKLKAAVRVTIKTKGNTP